MTELEEIAYAKSFIDKEAQTFILDNIAAIVSLENK